MNPSIQAQIKAAQAQLQADQKRRRGQRIPKAAESKGEASVRVALVHAFGDWFAGGEVVSELELFAKRAFRADFALPRYRAVVEVVLTPPDTPILIDAIQNYIARTQPTSRESISVVRVTTPKGFYHKLRSGHDDA